MFYIYILLFLCFQVVFVLVGAEHMEGLPDIPHRQAQRHAARIPK